MKIKLIIISVVLLSLISCEDVLDVTPQDRISAADVFQDENLARLYINATYIKAFPQGLYRDNQIGHATNELHTTKSHNVFYPIIARGELSADNVTQLSDYMNNWSAGYSVIRDANNFFIRIEDADFEEEIKNGMIGEMIFVRAFTYANLIWRYGGVPIIAQMFELDDDFSVERDSYDDCVEFIVEEMDKVIELLPDQQTDENLGKVSADAARALKSRALLYAASPFNNPNNDQAKWQAASDAAKELIDTRYSLHGDYHDLFLAHNDEVIFARYHTSGSRLELNLNVGRNYDTGWGSDSPTQNLVDNYEMANGELPYLPDGSINSASGFDPQNPYIDRDPRFHASILYDGSFWMDRETETFHADQVIDSLGHVHGVDTRDGPVQSHDGTMSGYYLKKFVTEEVLPTRDAEYPSTPWIMFRYGEILLNYAEAEFMLGNEGVARDYLNMIRSRTGVEMPPVTESGNELLERIRHERHIELVFEGHRFFDVRRWKIAPITEAKNKMGVYIEKALDGTKTYTYNNILLEREWDDRLYLLPIPYEEITRSNGSLVQNPGYE